MKKYSVMIVAMLMGVNAMAGQVITMENETGGRKSETKVYVDGAKWRMDMEDGPEKGMLLSKDASKTIYLVNFEKKEYMLFDPKKMMEMVKQAMGPMMPKMNVKDLKSEKILDEAGPKMLGYDTKHKKIKVSFTMEMEMFGQKSESQVIQETEAWLAAKMNGDWYKAWDNMKNSQMGDMGMDKVIEEYTKLLEGGAAVKVINKSTTTQKGGMAPQINESTMEIKSIKEEAIAADRFELPSGYKEVKIEDMMKESMESMKQMPSSDEMPMPPSKVNKAPKKGAAPMPPVTE